MIRRHIYEEEHEMFRDSVRRWVEENVQPKSLEWAKNGCVDRETWRAAGAQGFLCMWAPEEYGGAGIDDFRFDMVLQEEFTQHDSGFFIHLHNRIAGPYLRRFGTDDQKARFLPGMVSGDVITAIALTEPDAGSDLAGMKSFAEDRGDHWVLNGSKTYISNGILSDLVIVAARTSREKRGQVGLFLVERGMKGFRRGRNLEKMGLHGQDTAELFFDDVIIPKENVLDDPTRGFKYVMQGLAEERLVGALKYISRAERAFGITMDYIKERKAFGQPIGTFQNSRFVMADLRTKLNATWAFVDYCARDHMAGELSAEMAAQIKLMTSEVEWETVDACLQLHGGAGYMQEYEICRLFQDARISRIYAGSSEIMKEIIGRSLGLDDRKPVGKS